MENVVIENNPCFSPRPGGRADQLPGSQQQEAGGEGGEYCGQHGSSPQATSS